MWEVHRGTDRLAIAGSFCPAAMGKTGKTGHHRHLRHCTIELKGSDGWAVGAGGGIYHTGNGGLSWAKVRSPTNNDLLAIFFRDEREGWIGGDKLIVLGFKQQLAHYSANSM